jgi:LacI family transcriptional regulator
MWNRFQFLDREHSASFAIVQEPVQTRMLHLPAKRMRRKPNIAAVSKRAGVAISTVSRYLNGHYVSAEARARIARVIEKLGYKRSSTARNLSLGRRGCIGVVVDSSQDPWFTRLLAGIEEELSLHDTSLMLASTELTGKYDPRIVLEWVRERRVDGLVIVKSQRRDRGLIREAVEAQLPTVLIAPDEVFNHVQLVRCDNRAAGIAVADHLVELGHGCVAFAGGPQHSTDSKHRLLGLREGLRKHGLRLDPGHEFSCGSYEAEAGARFAGAFFGKSRKPTAVVFANDALASGFIRIAHQRGVKIPEELSVVGFDGLPEGELFWPALTTVAQPMRQMGAAGCRRLFEAIEAPDQVQTIEFPMRLIVRGSTGPARIRSAARSSRGR